MPLPCPTTFFHNSCSELPKDWCALACVAGVFLFFLLLPVRSDPSLVIGLSCLCGILALRGKAETKKLLRNPLVRVAALSFACFFLVTVLSSVPQWELLRQTPRILLWGAAFTAGICISALMPGHGFHFFAALVLILLLSLVFAAVVIGTDSPSIWQYNRLKLFAMHPSRLALLCAAGIFYTVHRLLTAPNLPLACLFFSLTALLMWVLHLTNTRAVFLMVPLGLAMFVFSLPRQRIKGFIITGLVILLVAAGALYATRHLPHSARLISAVGNISRDPTFLSRMPIWETGWEAFKEAPILGNGFRSFPELYAKKLSVSNREWTERYGLYDKSAKNAHNLLLSRMVESGALGATGFALFFLSGAVAVCRLPRRNRWVLALPVFYMGIGLVDDTLYRANDIFVFLTLGAATGLYATGGEEEGERADQAEHSAGHSPTS